MVCKPKKVTSNKMASLAGKVLANEGKATKKETEKLAASVLSQKEKKRRG